MITYAEADGETPFDWMAFLNRHPDNYTDDEWLQAKLLASRWVTCACGNLCVTIPRLPPDHLYCPGRPVDPKLSALGSYFTRQVHARNRDGALRVLRRIEERSGEILADLHLAEQWP